MVNLYGISNILTAATSSAMSIFVLTRSRNNRLCRIWAAFAACVAIYGTGAFMASSAADERSAFIWWQISYVGVIMLPALFLHFVYAFLDLRRYYLPILIYAMSFMILATDILTHNLFIGSVSIKFADHGLFSPAWWVYPPGPVHVFYVFFMYVGVLAYAHCLLIRGYSHATQHKRYQIRYFFIATALGFAGGGSSFLPCFGLNIYPALNITVPLYPLIMTYAIIRHQLMDIDIIIKKTIVFTALFLAVLGMFVGVTLFSQQVLGGGKILGLAISAVVIVLIIRPLEDLLMRATDRHLFQKKYDYKKLLKTFADEVLTVLGLSDLVNLTVDKLVDIMKLESAAILLRDDDVEEFRTAGSRGIDNTVYSLSHRDRLISYMEGSEKYILLEGRDPKTTLIGNFEKYARDLNAVMLIPLMSNGKLAGILALGKKKSDEEFTQDDIDILMPLARTLSIAITNAQLFVKLSEAQATAAQKEKMAVIGTLSAGINHEICNPLGIARGQCEMFLLNIKEGLYKDKSPQELIEKAQEIMTKVIRETDRATVITRKLSSFAKPAKGATDNNVRLDEEIKEVISLLEHDLRLDNITIFTDIEKDLPYIAADRKQVQEVFFNIIRNAAQSIGLGGQITIRAVSANRKVYIDIKDSGPGISKRHLNQIFDPFFTTKDPGQGTGLGLFIVKQLLERNNGQISVQSESGKGTNFRIVFNAAGNVSP